MMRTRSPWATAVRVLAAAVAVLALMLGVGALLIHQLVHGAVGRLDDSIERDLLAGRTSTWSSLTQAGTQLAEPLTVEVLLAVVVVGLALVGRRVLPPLFLAVTVILESAIYFTTSTLEPRPRPTIPRLGTGDPVASYPSGHVAASIAFYGGCAVLAWVCTDSTVLRAVTTGLAVVVPPLVGLCRMYRGFHHLSDVLAGALLGGLWLALTTGLLLVPLSRRARPAGRTGAARLAAR